MKSKKNRIITAGIGYIIGGVLIKGVAFITTPIFTRLLSTEEFGILNTYLSYESIITMIIGFQFAASLKSARIEYESDRNGINKYLSNIISLMLIHSILILLLANLFSKDVIKATGISSIFMLNVLILNAYGAAAVNVYNAYIALSYNYKRYLTIGLFNAVGNVLLSIVLIKTCMSDNRSTARILGYAIPYLIIALYVTTSAYKSSREIVKKKYIKFIYSYCLPLIPNGCAEVMLGQFGKLTVERNCGLSTMGIYSLSYNIYSIIGIIRIAMDYLIGPFFFEKKKTGESDKLSEIVRIYSRTLGMISVIVMLFSPEIVAILGDVQYFDARKSAIPLVAASYFVFLCSTVSQEVYYLKKTKVVSWVSVSAMVVNIALSISVIPRYGALAAAFCTMTSYMIMVVLYYVMIRSYFKSNAFDWKAIFIDVIFVSIMTIVSLAIVDMLIVRVCVLIVTFLTMIIYGKKVIAYLGGRKR